MTGPNIKQNQVPSDPSLNDLLSLLKKEIFLDLQCHHLGTVQSFDADTQTVEATINYTKTFFKLNSQTGLYDPIQVSYPTLIGCPLVVMGGGGANLTFPIAAGDECLLLFNDRDFDNWFAGSKFGPSGTARLHSFADAIALVGVNSLSNSIENYDSTRAVLRNGTTLVGVGASLIKIANDTTTLNTLLQDLIDILKALTVNTSTGNPNPPWVTNLTMLATQIEGLLE